MKWSLISIAQRRAKICNKAKPLRMSPQAFLDDLVIFWDNVGSYLFYVQCQFGRLLWRLVSVPLCLFIQASPAHFTATAGWRHQVYFDVAVAQRLFLMRTGSELTLWSSCFHASSMHKWSNHISGSHTNMMRVKIRRWATTPQPYCNVIMPYSVLS